MTMQDRVARAEAAYRACRLCPRNCGVDRFVSSHGAFCRLGEHATVYKELLSLGEEAVLTPTWLVDLGGCSLRCLFCTEWTHVVKPTAKPAVRLDPAWFVPRLQKRRQQGAKTLSFVGGDPTVSLLGVLRALAAVPESDWLPIVWNCNGLLSDTARELLAGVVASWVVDLKFGNPECAQRIAGVQGFVAFQEVARTLDAVQAMARRPQDVDLPPLIVRHLVMPGHETCCTRPVLDWLAAHHPQVPVNLMTVYLPSGPAARAPLPNAPELSRLATDGEVQAVLAYARRFTANLWLDGRPVRAPTKPINSQDIL